MKLLPKLHVPKPSRQLATSALEVTGLALVVVGAGVLAVWLGLVLAGLVLVGLGYLLSVEPGPGDEA